MSKHWRGGGTGGGTNGLTSITIPGNVTNIGSDAFEGCLGLKAITVDTNDLAYSSVNGVLFDKNQVTLIQYPSGKFGNYILPISVTNLGAAAFEDCSFLTGITIPNGVTSIQPMTFSRLRQS